MSKTRNKPTREGLADEAKAKLTAAEEALETARQSFAGATNDDDRVKAQEAINAASREVERYRAASSALDKPAAGAAKAAVDEDKPTLRGFTALGEIHHSGRVYREGEPIELTKAEHDALPKGSVA